MLRKLIKYELISTARVMLPLYMLMLIAFAVMGVNLGSSSATGSFGVVNILATVLFIAGILIVMVTSVVLIIQRFRKNLLGQEGYLMFTLPVTTMQNILCKAIGSLLWIIGGMAVGVISGIVLVIASGEWEYVTKMLKVVWNLLMTQVKNPGLIVAGMIISLILGILEAVFKVYGAISMGHLWTDHRILGGILAYLGCSAVEMVLSGVVNIHEKVLDFTYELTDVQAGMSISVMTMPGILATVLVSIAGILVYGFISWWILDRKLNLE